MQKRWNIKTPPPDKVEALQNELKIHPVFIQMLVSRGIETFDQAKSFFRPSLDELHDPYLMKDMDKAVERLDQAINNHEKILVYGDYDVDGTTSVAMMYSFLKTVYYNIDFYIPNRYSEGYGISFQSIDYASENNFSLIIALDCGIKANDKIEYAQLKGIDYIICDHHLPGEEIPKATAVLDPKRSDCQYPYKELSGCGVGFKLIQAFCIKKNLPKESAYEYLDLLCTSIAADIVPITGENRTLAFHGLKKIHEKPAPGLKSLTDVAGLKKVPDITDVVFIIAPRINAAGRMEDARYAVNLLIGETHGDIKENAGILNDFNQDRKDLDKTITSHALQIIEENPELKSKRSTVLYHSDWHKGVLGIVASRLTETWYRPTIIMTETEGGKLVGSARSIRDFDLYEAIYACKDFLIQFGGHKFAAGLTMQKENFQAFSEAFENYVLANSTPNMFIPEIDIDAELEPSYINEKFYSILQQFAPFGPGNMKPQFVSRQLCDSGWSKIVKEDHLKLHVKDKYGVIGNGIGFGLAPAFDLLKKGAVDVVYQIEENVWQDKVSLQWMVKDVKLS